MFLSPGLTQHTMEQMLERAGVPREVNLQGPTEVRTSTVLSLGYKSALVKENQYLETFGSYCNDAFAASLLPLLLPSLPLPSSSSSFFFSLLLPLLSSFLLSFSQMHNLLELIRLEQDIYNVCFHELIRQVSVHCVERGELLADLRQRYSSLLDRVPRQVKM